MSAEIIDFDGHRAAKYIIDAIKLFLIDPPDTDTQRAYLSALLAVYKEGIGKGKDDDRIALAERLTRAP